MCNCVNFTCAINTFIWMSVAFASSTDSNISYCIEVWFQYLWITEHFITKCIQTIQWDSNIGCGYPILMAQWLIFVNNKNRKQTRNVIERSHIAFKHKSINELIASGVYTCNSMLCSKLYALGLPSSVENATLPSRNGEISLYSLVQNARDSCSPFFPVRNSDKLSGKPYVSRHVALLMPSST